MKLSHGLALNGHPSGRHFLQIPGPTNVPDRILRAMDYPTIDHRGPEFQKLGRSVLAGMQAIFQTRAPVVIYPASGTGAWEAALVNALSPGDAVLMCETGHFAGLWKRMAERLGLVVEFLREEELLGDYGRRVNDKAREAARSARLPRSYWDWEDMIKANGNGFFPSTPATNLLYGLHEAIAMLQEEGLPKVFARHRRHAEATRAAVRAWGLEILCTEPEEYSPALTAVLMPEGRGADAFRKVALENFNLSLGQGLGQIADKVFRIGHLGDFNDLMLMGTLCGVEMGLGLAGVPHRAGGAQAAMTHLAATRGDGVPAHD